MIIAHPKVIKNPAAILKAAGLAIASGGGGQAIVVASSKAYTYRGSGVDSGGPNDATFSIDIGTASADRLVIVAVWVSTATTVTSVVVNGVTLTADISAVNTYRVAIYSALVTTGSGPQNVVVTFGSASFQEKCAAVWTATGLASNLVKNTLQSTTGSGSVGTINVTAGDFLFVGNRTVAGSTAWTTSTEAPDGTRNVATNATPADWQIDATNAAFSIVASSGTNNQMVAASYS